MNVLDLGLERAGMRTIAFCEIEPYCRAVLRKHWPDIPIFEDVRKLSAGDVYRMHALGNAVVPQIPEIIGKAIMQTEGLI